MNEEVVEGEISRIVYKKSRDTVESYLSVNWRASEISFNSPVFENLSSRN